ncbi:tRNA pseudouridine(38-40) synthase TruA [Halovenus marina]|uniref:tRNA pseudouridine(38-40) synthase TruA n=1 Tax=Halovenus marina TaxID=3396621 RepID=UPI003F54358E
MAEDSADRATSVRAYRIAYDGRPFHGFQRQPDVETVEGVLLDALSDLGVVESGTPRGYAAAGRTDAGVSAVAQTVAFAAPDWLDPAAFSSELPAEVRVWTSADVPADFHATHDATEREYTYHLYAPDGSISRARTALDELSGEHDFHNLTPDEEGTVRTLSTAVRRDGDFLIVSLRAGGFARQLVRRLVSVVAAVARGETELARIERVLGADSLSGPEGVAPAPAYPLVLTDVVYPDVSFETDDSLARTRAIFEETHVRERTEARMTETLAGAFDAGTGDRSS